MLYARVNMVEFKTREQMDRTIAQLRDKITSVLPEIRVFTSMETSQTSQLTISVHDNKDAADRAISQRDTHLFDKEMADLFAHEGTVNCLYVEEQQIANLLDSRS